MKQLLFTSILALLFINGFAQTATSFNVGGDIDKFYPVTFKDANWYLNKETEISIGRSDTHIDSEWRGSLISSFKFHTFMWGNGSAYINAFVKSSQVFIAGWQDASGSNSSREIIIWLKGGGTTYALNSSANVDYTIYDGVQHALPFVEENGPQHTFKTAEDSYVSSYQQYLAADLRVEGNVHINGKTGIGTSSPLNGLHIFALNNQAAGSLRLGNSGSEDAVMSFGWNGVDQDAFKISKYAHNSTVNPADLLTINTTNGNLGLGTSAPDQKLTVKGGIGFDFNSTDKKLYSSDDGMLEWMTHDAAGQHGFAVSHQNIKRVLLNTNGNSYFLGGNLGIGTASPIEKLSVNGKIRAHEIKVEATNWPDYVFMPSYKLSSLSELERQIKLNGHLPGMPSAKEVETNGIALGEMNKLLLKKVEELTLHLIEKDKVLNKQQEIIKAQEQRLNAIEKEQESFKKILLQLKK